MKKIGEIFTYENKKLKTIEEEGCDNCYFNNLQIRLCGAIGLQCTKDERMDRLGVIFKLIEFKFGR